MRIYAASPRLLEGWNGLCKDGVLKPYSFTATFFPSTFFPNFTFSHTLLTYSYTWPFVPYFNPVSYNYSFLSYSFSLKRSHLSSHCLIFHHHSYLINWLSLLLFPTIWRAKASELTEASSILRFPDLWVRNLKSPSCWATLSCQKVSRNSNGWAQLYLKAYAVGWQS